MKFIFERHVSNLDNWAITVKVLIVLHRGLQNIKVNRKIYKELKQKEHLIHSYEKKTADKSYDIKMYHEISKLYCSYIKYFLNVHCKTDILCKSLAKISDDVRVLKTN